MGPETDGRLPRASFLAGRRTLLTESTSENHMDQAHHGREEDFVFEEDRDQNATEHLDV